MANEIIKVFLAFNETMSKGLDKVDTKLSSFKNNIDKVQSVLAPLSLAAGVAIGASVKAASDWSKTSSGAARGLDLAGKDLENFKRQTEDLAKSLNFQRSSTELLELSTSVGKLGVAVKDVPSYTETLVKLAVATDQLANVDELGTNIAKIGTVFNFSKQDVLEYGAAVNKLDDITSATSNEIIDFTKRVSGIGATSKLSATQLSAWGATLISSGQAPNVAATFMNKFLTVLGAAEAQTEKTQNNFEKLGFTAKELATSFDKDASGTMIKFLDRLKGLSTLEQRNVVANIFGQEHVDSASQLLAVYDKLIPNIKQAADTSGNIAKVNREFEELSKNSLEGQLNTVKNQFLEIAKTLGLALLPSIISINKLLVPLLNGFLTFAKANPAIVSIGVALLGLVAIAAPIVSVFSTIVTIATTLPVIATALTGVFAAVTAFISGVLFSIAGVVTALASIVIWAAPVLIPILAIGTAAFLIWKNWDFVKGVLLGIFNALIGAAKAYWEYNVWVATLIKDAFVNTFTWLGQFLSSTFNSYVQLWRDSFLFVFGQETINNVMQIGENLKLIMGRSILAIVDLWKFQINLIVQAWQGLVNFILPILNQIVSAWNTTVNYISSTWTQAWNLVTLGFQTAMNNIVTTTTNGVNRVIGAWNSFINPIQKSIYDAFVYASGVVINWGNTIVNALNNLTARFTSWVSNLAVSAYNWGANFISNFAKGIQDNIAQATGAVANMTRAVADFLPHSPSEKGAFRTLGETGFAFTDTFISGIKKSGIDGFFNNLFSAPENNLGLSNPSRNQETQQGLQLIYAPVITGSKNDADYILAQLKSRERDLLDLLDKANRRTGRGNY